MGEMAEYYRDFDFSEQLSEEADKLWRDYQNNKPIFWKTQSGQKINIKSLTPQHKSNIIKMLEKSTRKDREEWLIILKNNLQE